MAEALRVKQRGFAIPQLMLVLAGVGLAVALLLGGYHAGGNAERAKSQKQKLADIAAGQQRDAAVSSALADQHDRRALAEERAAKAEAQSKETRNAARRNRLVLGSCLERPETPAPARADAVAGEPAGSGVVADRGPARDAGVRLYWRFVGLHDGAFTGISGEPLFRDSAQFAGDPARADTASPYGLDDVAEVAAENASALSTCRRAYFGALDTLRAAESAYGKGP